MIGILFVADQMLIPMLHFKGIPFKLSYLFLAYFILEFITNPYGGKRLKLFVGFTGHIIALILLCLMGELWQSASVGPGESSQIIPYCIFYILIALSFGLGIRCKKFDYNFMPKLLIAAVVLNLTVVYAQDKLPQIFKLLYFQEFDSYKWQKLGIIDVDHLLQISRSRGAFGNPNVSMTMVNTIFLFIYLGNKHKLCKIRSNFIKYLIVILPISLAVILGTRSGFFISIVIAILSIMHFDSLKIKKYIKINFLNVLVKCFMIVGIMAMLLFIFKDNKLVSANLNRIKASIEIITNPITNEYTTKNKSLIGRFLLFDRAGGTDRFFKSPIIGSGFAIRDNYPYDYAVIYYHNDWVFILVTCGLLGFLVIVRLLKKYPYKLGWQTLICFFVPGLTNSFWLVYPSILLYFFMIGVIFTKKYDL